MVSNNKINNEENEVKKTSIKDKVKTKVKTSVVNYAEKTVAEYDENPLENLQNGVYLIQFLYSLFMTLVNFAFSTISLILKVRSDGWQIKTYVLLGVNAIYLLVIFIYVIIYNSKKKHKDNIEKYQELLANTKFAMKALKFIVPVVTLINLYALVKNNPTALLYVSTAVTAFSILSGFIGFIKACFKLNKFYKGKDKRIAKNQKKQERATKFNDFYTNARNKKQLKDNTAEIQEKEDTTENE